MYEGAEMKEEIPLFITSILCAILLPQYCDEMMLDTSKYRNKFAINQKKELLTLTLYQSLGLLKFA